KYRFGFELHGQGFWPEIKTGFQYDGASVPRVVWTLIGFLPDGIHRPAALIHDWFYLGRGQVNIEGKKFVYDRKFADELFYQALKHVGVKSWHAWLAHVAVRRLGWIYWKD
ncbi:MAG: DUF1353 domain-containing protein, partial [Candidatus Puniceispirillaceae bacterium]